MLLLPYVLAALKALRYLLFGTLGVLVVSVVLGLASGPFLGAVLSGCNAAIELTTGKSVLRRSSP